MLAIVSVQKSNKKKIQQCWYRLSTKKGLFQEKQELYTWTLLMKNRKLEIFLVLILGTKGKLLPRQKTQQIFLSSLKSVSPHLSHWARAQQSWGWHPSRAQGGDCWLWPSRKCTSFVLHGFPFSTCTCSVVVSEPSSDLLNMVSKWATCSEII